MRDFIFNPEIASNGYVDRTTLKKKLASVLGDRVAGEETRYLFSYEPRVDEPSPYFRLRLLGGAAIPAELNGTAFKEVEVEVPSEGQNVEVSVWVSLDNDDFAKAKSRGLTMNEYGPDRIETVALSRFKDALDISASFAGTEIRVIKAQSKGHTLNRAYGHFRAVGKVKSAAALRLLMENGIGASKAYGFGLVAATPVN